jgi:phosphoribosyl-dephospho-CoA transferase
MKKSGNNYHNKTAPIQTTSQQTELNNNKSFLTMPNNSIKKLKENKESKQLFNQAIKEINEALVKSSGSTKKPQLDSAVKQIKQNKAIKQVIDQAVKILSDSFIKMKDELYSPQKIVDKPNTRSNLVSRNKYFFILNISQKIYIF